MNDDARSFEATYLGEVAPRRPIIAFLLGLACPGVGWTYVGRVGLGLATNAAAVALWAGFVLVWATRKFYPVVPFRTFLLGWLVIAAMAGFDAALTAARQSDRYVLRDSNHPLVYGAVALFTFALPLLALHHVATHRVWSMETVADDAMYPTLVEGDRILVDVRAHDARDPRLGEVVLYRLDQDVPRFGRVVGTPGDAVAVTWDSVFVNDVPGERFPVGDDLVAEVRALSGQLDHDVRHFVENLGGVAYHITTPTRGYTAEPLTWDLGDDEFVVLNDNRTDPDDSRRIGVVTRDEIAGSPVFVGFSTTRTIADVPFALRALTLGTDGGRFRTDRQGRRVQPLRTATDGSG